MIMLGTTPRHLSRGSALGALALAALTLPLTPSWAQKPEEHSQEIVTIVKTDQDLAVKPAEFANTDIELVLTTDGQVDKIKADSLDKAINEIKDRIKSILKENEGSKESAARVKALKQALEDIEKSRGNINVEFRADGNKKSEEKKVVIRKIEDAKQGKLTAEKKAQIDKAKARVEALRNELRSTQKKLHEAEMDFIKMKGDVHGSLEIRPEIHTRIEPVQVRIRRREDALSSAEHQKKQAAEHAAVAERHQKQAAEHAEVAERQKKQVEEHAASAEKNVRLRLDTDRALTRSERERLTVLEKRMAELLEEVARLKKQGK